MESWNSVINTALLGTEKRSLKAEEVDPAFHEHFTRIQEQAQNKEDAFLQSAALVYNYRQAGFLPLQKETVSIAQAEAEERLFASPFAHVVLTDILDTGSVSLFRFWLEQCSQAERIVQPEFIPVLLQNGTKNKTIAPLMNACCGKRGAWLRQFNEEWKEGETATEEERWQTGTLAQRKEVLAQARQRDPAKGRELVQQTWAQEPAATKVDLLEQLQINAGADDVEWLEEIQAEKSVKVKEAALQVLKRIPTSPIVQQYWHILKASIKLVKSKGLLGITTKSSLEINLAPVDPSVFKTGIQQLSSDAKVKDNDFILYQLIAAVPPHFWEAHFNLEKEKVLALFTKDERAEALFPALGLAASRFKEIDWLQAVMEIDRIRLYSDAFELLPQKEAEAYGLRFLDKDLSANSVMSNIHHFKKEWSVEFAKGILCYTAKNPYQFHHGFYNELAAVLPGSVTGVLEKCTPKEEHLRPAWSNMSDHIIRLITLKQQTIEAFNNS
jgi:hypothetical protein